MKSRINTFLMAAFCCLFLAACAESCGSGGDMSESSGDETAVAENQADADQDMDSMDESDAMAESDEGDEMAEGAAAAGAAAAGAAAGEAAGEAGGAVAEGVESVAGRGAAMATAPIELVPGEVELPDYGWKLLWFGSNEINQEVGADITLRFAPGTLAGSSGCNQYNGSFEAGADHALTVGELASTRMACPEGVMAIEQRYLAMLRSAARYEFKKDGLYLYDPAGDWLHFAPEEPSQQ